MTTPKFSNNATTTVPAAIGAADTSITVATGTGALFPTLAASQYFKATLQDVFNNTEIIKVTGRAGDTLAVERAQEGTSAQFFPANSRLELRALATSTQEYVDSLDFLLL